jgi:putative ABC transport system permease protein
MNLFELVLRQMRQRALSTWLTLLSVLLGVALAVAIMILRREAGALFGQNEYGYDVIVGAKGSPLQLVLNTVYQIDRSPGNISYAMYERLQRSPQYRGMVKIAVPYAVGDSYRDHRIIGTTNRLFNTDDKGKPLTYVKFIKDTGGNSEGDTAGLPAEEAKKLIDSGAAGVDADGFFQYRPGRRYEIDQGRVFESNKFEAVIGSDVAAETGLKLGEEFQAVHGMPAAGEAPDVHAQKWKVVGVLKPTRTAADRVIFIPLVSFYTITEHDEALAAQEAIRRGDDPNRATAVRREAHKHEEKHDDHDHDDHGHGHKHIGGEEGVYHVLEDGTIELELPKEIWAVSAVLIKARSAPMAFSLIYNIRNGPEAEAVNPAETMRTFFANFLSGPSLVLLLIVFLVTIVAGIGILVSIYNSVSARLREIAILRALGATRGKILALICCEAGLIGLIGGVLGMISGHALGAAGSAFAQRILGESINWYRVGREEWFYLAAVVLIAVLAGLVPALKAYRTPVATNLVAG